MEPKQLRIREDIIFFLKEIENEHNVKIIYACETGSRAQGISVEGSDYDIKGF